MKKVFLAAFCFTLFAMGGVAHAVPWTWEDTYDPADVTLKAGSSMLFVHDITDNGFNPGQDSITQATLTLVLYDDKNSNTPIYASIDITKGFLQNQTFTYVDEKLNVLVTGRIFLDSTGKLMVILTTLSGDFIFARSWLTVHGNEANPVPEPATMLLMGSGLLAMGIARRFRPRGPGPGA